MKGECCYSTHTHTHAHTHIYIYIYIYIYVYIYIYLTGSLYSIFITFTYDLKVEMHTLFYVSPM